MEIEKSDFFSELLEEKALKEINIMKKITYVYMHMYANVFCFREKQYLLTFLVTFIMLRTHLPRVTYIK